MRVRLLATVPLDPFTSNVLCARTLPGGSPIGPAIGGEFDNVSRRCGDDVRLGTIARFAPMLVSLPLTMPA